jgi:hypothetical protein
MMKALIIFEKQPVTMSYPKTIFQLIMVLAGVQFALAQDTTKISATQEEIKKVDNYTVQYLIISNNKNEVLLQKNNAGWHTLAIRSNENQSIREAMDSLAHTVGIKISDLRLAGLYAYKFEGLPDHQAVSFRTHYTSRAIGGELMQPKDPQREYKWVPINEAMKKITFESLRLETSQILKNPKKVWGGTFLIMWQGDKFLGSRVLEPPYVLSD